MPFEVFEKSQVAMTRAPTLTVQRRGSISLNRSAWALIDDAEHVELLWDAELKLMGLRPTSEDNPHAYPVRSQTPKSATGPVVITGTLFTRYIGLDTSHARRWTPTMIEGVLCVDLTEPGTPVENRRTQQGSGSD